MAINEPHMTCEEIVYGLRYDSEYGQFKEEIEVKSTGSPVMIYLQCRQQKTNLLLARSS